jgi:hypothetical protein
MQGLIFALQVLYHLSHSPSLLINFLFLSSLSPLVEENQEEHHKYKPFFLMSGRRGPEETF